MPACGGAYIGSDEPDRDVVVQVGLHIAQAELCPHEIGGILRQRVEMAAALAPYPS